MAARILHKPPSFDLVEKDLSGISSLFRRRVLQHPVRLVHPVAGRQSSGRVGACQQGHHHPHVRTHQRWRVHGVRRERSRWLVADGRRWRHSGLRRRWWNLLSRRWLLPVRIFTGIDSLDFVLDTKCGCNFIRNWVAIRCVVWFSSWIILDCRVNLIN